MKNLNLQSGAVQSPQDFKNRLFRKKMVTKNDKREKENKRHENENINNI